MYTFIAVHGSIIVNYYQFIMNRNCERLDLEVPIGADMLSDKVRVRLHIFIQIVNV